MKITANNESAYRLFHEGTLALARAERQGIRVDMEYAESKSKELEDKINDLENKLKTTRFFKDWVFSLGTHPNIHSNTQLANYLYNVKKLTPATRTKKSGKGATDEGALEKLNIPELNDLLTIRRLKKLKDTYLNAFIREAVNGVMHPNFNLNIPVTYRSSSSTPNFQNIPKRDKEAMNTCRGALFPRLDHQLMEIDFSGAEVRVACAYHKDTTMLKYINDPTSDMHADLSKQIFIMPNFDKSIPSHKVLRAATKNGFVFPQFYGDYYKNNAKSMACDWGKLPEGKWKKGQGMLLDKGTLSDHMLDVGIKSLNDFTEHIRTVENDFWNNRFYEYQQWKEKWWASYQKKGYVDMLSGFRCSGIMNKKEVINYPIQGASFHCLLWCLNRTDALMQKENWDSRIIGQIHDSIIIDTNPKERDSIIRKVQKIISHDLPSEWKWINVPMEAEIELGEVNASLATIKNYSLD